MARVIVLLLYLAVTVPAFAQHAVKMSYDPKTNTWSEVQPPAAGTPEGDLAIGRELYARGERSDAEDVFESWFKTYGEHVLGAEVRVALARCMIDERDYYEAHLLLRDLLVDYASDELTMEAAELEFVVAEVFLTGTKRKWYGMRILDARELGIEILDEISSKFPQTVIGEQALKAKADFFYSRGAFDFAEDDYNRMLVEYPRSHYVRYAALRRAQSALARFPGIEFDDAPLVEAEERFLRYRDDFPQDAEEHRVDLVLEDIRSRRADKELSIGQYYLKVGEQQAAVFYFKSVLQNWPSTVAAARAEAELINLGILSAESNPEDTNQQQPES